MKPQVIIGTIVSLAILGGLVYLGLSYQSERLTAPAPDVDEFSQPLTALPEQSPTPMMTNATIEPINEEVNVVLKTKQGDITLTLHGAAAPTTVGNFVQLAEADFYDGTTFHRIIPDFMIQGGDPYSKDPANQALVGSGDPGYKFADEINERKLVRGSVAMANSGPNTNGSQFFIVTAVATPWLDGLHTNFGEVTGGLDVLDAIAAVSTDAGDRPLTPIVIEDVVVER